MSEIFIPGTIKPEADYLELERLGAKLGIPVPIMYIDVESKNADGEIIYQNRDRSRTFNRNFWNMAFTRMSGGPVTSSASFAAANLGVKAYSGTVRAISSGLQNTVAIYSGINNNNQFDLSIVTGLTVDPTNNAGSGIFVGSGVAVESFEGFTLSSLITSGNAAGQLAANAMLNATPAYNAGTKVWTLATPRIFNNNSGGSIVVTETALVGMFVTSNGTGSPTMFERSLLGAPVTVLNGGQLTVTYTMTMTFPA